MGHRNVSSCWAGIISFLLTHRDAQEVVEYALLAAGVLIPLTFGIIFVSEVLWVWHSVADFNRDGARYAASHCWQADNSNVSNYMTSHVPRMIDMDQFASGSANITVEYYQRDASTGLPAPFSCDGSECSTACVPDAVTVRVSNYEFRRFFVTFLKLPAITLPDFHASMAVGGGGCDETGNCQP